MFLVQSRLNLIPYKEGLGEMEERGGDGGDGRKRRIEGNLRD